MIYCVHICLLDFVKLASIIMVAAGEHCIEIVCTGLTDSNLSLCKWTRRVKCRRYLSCLITLYGFTSY